MIFRDIMSYHGDDPNVVDEHGVGCPREVDKAVTSPEGFAFIIQREVQQKSECHGAGDKVVAAEGLEDVLDDGVEILEEGAEDNETASR